MIIYFLKSLSYKSSYTTSRIYYNISHTYNKSPFPLSYNVFGYQKANVEVLMHTVHEDKPA